MRRIKRDRNDPVTGAFVHHDLSVNEKAVYAAPARRRAPGERANAQLTSWRVLRHVRMSPEHTATPVHAITTLITAAH